MYRNAVFFLLLLLLLICLFDVSSCGLPSEHVSLGATQTWQRVRSFILAAHGYENEYRENRAILKTSP